MKPSKNPWVIEFTKKSKDRECALNDIPFVQREDGTKGCIWCGEVLKSKHPSTRYCKDKECSESAYMWGYPQRKEAMFYLLKKQDYKCNDCGHDYKQYLDFKDGTEFKVWHYRRIRKKIPKEFRPEVDHIIPIMSGGQSLGLDNHQVLCYSCHKKKTKVDIKGEKVKLDKEEELNLIQMKDERTLKRVLNKIQEFHNDNFKGNKKEYDLKFKDNFIPSLSYEELGALERDLKIKIQKAKIGAIQEYLIKKLNWVQDYLY